MYYRIDAVDNWFFRDAAPFDAGVNTDGESIFPPFPSVYAGALRNCAVPVPNPERMKNTFARCLKIGWNGVIADKQILFPVPLDLYIKENNKKFTAHEMVLSPAGGSSFPLPYFLEPPEKAEKPPYVSGGAYINEDTMRTYLSGGASDYPVQPLGDYLSKETHIGIHIESSSGTAIKGDFYQQTVITPRKILSESEIRQCSLALEASGIEIPEKSIVRMGGEGKLAIISRIEGNLPIPDAPGNIENDNCFKLYLATPAIFEKGWLPGWINKEDMTGVFTHKKHSVRVKLIGAAVGKPLAVGGFGFDNEKNRLWPKELRYAVPAGSVYYFKLLDDGKMEDAVRLFHKKCISDYRETRGFHHGRLDRLRYCSRGFGYSLIGSISKNQKGAVYDV